MGTTSDKLTYLNETKTQIRKGLNRLGADLTSEDTFRSYASELDDIYDKYPKITGTGETLTLENTTEAQMQLDLLGNTQQDSTTGKNLLPISPFNNGYSLFTLTGDVVTQNNTTSASWVWGWARTFFRTTLPAGTYTLIMFANTKSTNNAAEFRVYKNDDTILADSGNQQKGETGNVTFTLNEETQIGIVAKMYDGAWKFMIVSGSTPDYDYEPYTNGASPNPSYPQDIHTCSGDNTIKIFGGTNLFNTTMIQGAYSFSDGSFFSSNNYISMQNKISVEAGKTYKLIFDGVQPSDNNSGFVFYNNGTAKSGLKTSSLIFTAPSGSNQVVYNLYKSGGISPSDISNIAILELKETQLISLDGKNLFDGRNVKTTNTTNWTISFGNDILTITHNNTYPQGYPTLEVGNLTQGTYVISGELGSQIGLYINNSYSKMLDNNSTFTCNDNDSIRLVFSPSQGTHLYKNVQLEKGNQATQYASYFDPIELCKIGTYQDYIRKSSGKNLFDKSAITRGYLGDSGTIATGKSSDRITPYIEITPNTQYVVSGLVSQYSRCASYDSSKNFISEVLANTSSATRTFTTPNNAKYILLSVSDYNDSKEIQLEKGETATSYEPYGFDGKWYLHKEIGKYTIQASDTTAICGDSFSQMYSNGNIARTFEVNSMLSANVRNNVICNCLQVKEQTLWNATSSGIQCYLNASKMSLSVPTSNIETYLGTTLNANNYASAFTSYLASIGSYFYYVLSTPTNTEITDTTLISQLENIYSMTGTTNITQENNDLAMDINAKALRGE